MFALVNEDEKSTALQAAAEIDGEKRLCMAATALREQVLSRGEHEDEQSGGA